MRVIRPNGTVDPTPWADVNRIYGIRWTALTTTVACPESRSTRSTGRTASSTSSFRCRASETGFPAMSLIVRFKEVNGRGTAPRMVLYRIRADVFDNVYSLVFGPDGMLYIPSGFLGRSRPKGEDPLADRRGKILRVTRDGKPPGDNPRGDAHRVSGPRVQERLRSRVLPRGPNAVAGESGPEAHDEINLVMPGHDYGYPDHQGETSARGSRRRCYDYGGNRTSPAGILHYTGGQSPPSGHASSCARTTARGSWYFASRARARHAC